MKARLARNALAVLATLLGLGCVEPVRLSEIKATPTKNYPTQSAA